MSILKRRIEALEGRMLPQFISLTMADGSVHKIRGGAALLDLFHDRTHPAWPLIIDSVSNDEEGHLIELLQAMAHGPIPRGQGWDPDGDCVRVAKVPS